MLWSSLDSSSWNFTITDVPRQHIRRLSPSKAEAIQGESGSKADSIRTKWTGESLYHLGETEEAEGILTDLVRPSRVYGGIRSAVRHLKSTDRPERITEGTGTDRKISTAFRQTKTPWTHRSRRRPRRSKSRFQETYDQQANSPTRDIPRISCISRKSIRKKEIPRQQNYVYAE